MTTTNISDFRANVRQYVDSVISDHGSLLINRGNTAAVLISLDEYNAIKATERVAVSSTEAEEILQGMDDWKGGKGIEVDIDDL